MLTLSGTSASSSHLSLILPLITDILRRPVSSTERHVHQQCMKIVKTLALLASILWQLFSWTCLLGVVLSVITASFNIDSMWEFGCRLNVTVSALLWWDTEVASCWPHWQSSSGECGAVSAVEKRRHSLERHRKWLAVGLTYVLLIMYVVRMPIIAKNIWQAVFVSLFNVLQNRWNGCDKLCFVCEIIANVCSKVKLTWQD